MLTDTQKHMEFEQHSEEWYRLHDTIITSSSVASILRLPGAYSTPEKVMRRMLKALTPADLAEDQRSTFAKNHGLAYEEIARSQYQRETLLSDESLFMTGAWVHPRYPFIGGSPDGIVICRDQTTGRLKATLLEIKCPLHKLYDEVKPIHMTQIQTCLEIVAASLYPHVDVDVCHYYVWKDGVGKLFVVNRDPAMFARYLPELEAFYNNFKIERYRLFAAEADKLPVTCQFQDPATLMKELVGNLPPF